MISSDTSASSETKSSTARSANFDVRYQPTFSMISSDTSKFA
jgi:hypothetical protein